ncbi:hypothetical protein HAX54_048574 [Datura stramonium]|uniref:Uncharacterized protein n=1 Tax=Datura stramonium TaxID=4076 RepID=A0ABS8WLT2_DATST|nr:hypothetical protein [Datura stramonium]
MERTQKNMQWSLYFLYKLTALLARYKLVEPSNELKGVIEKVPHHIGVIHDPTDEIIKKKEHGQCITTMENEIQQLRLELEDKYHAFQVEQKSRDQWMKEQFENMISISRGANPTRNIGIQVDPAELEASELSATDGTVVAGIELANIGYPPAGEGKLIRAADTYAITLKDRAAPSTEVQDQSSLQPESS